ncbi:MAG: nucleotidyltransferase [Clostridiales bacterium]|jgi:dTDP-glucose pyrophosphorylase|nr:nucleotidyltransferase [Clostridiales bacterium]
MKPTLVVLAAGIGSRYGGMKQAEPVGVNGELLLDYSIFDSVRAGFGKTVFVIKREHEELFRRIAGDKLARYIEVAYAFQELDDLPPGFSAPPGRTKPWGTSHALLSCRHIVDTPFAVINTDDFYGRGTFEALSGFLRDTPAKAAVSSGPDDRPPVYNFAMVGFALKNTLTEHGTVSRGVCQVDSEDYLIGITERTRIEKRDGGAAYMDEDEQRPEAPVPPEVPVPPLVRQWTPIPGDTIVSMNAWGFTPEIFAEAEYGFKEFLRQNINDEKAEYYLPTLVDQLISAEKARVKVLRSNERWFGITYKADKERVTSAIKEMTEQNKYPLKLWP